MPKKEILIIENLAAFEKIINKDDSPYDINMMCMPGTLEDKHKYVDPEKGIQALRRRFKSNLPVNWWNPRCSSWC